MKKLPSWKRFSLLRKYSLCAFSLGIVLQSCNVKEKDVTPTTVTTLDINNEVATKWADMTLRLVRGSSGFTPPVASRALGYTGLTMYESIVPALSQNKSLAGQLNSLAKLPTSDPNLKYNWALSLNAAQASINKNIFANTSAANKLTIDSLETALKTAYTKTDAADVVTRSTKFGQDLATVIFEWSKTDGGHEGYAKNFPTDYVVPVFPGSWQPTENGRKIPMQPYWGKNRTFLTINSQMVLPKPIAFSDNITSQNFAQYLEVYTKNKTLTQEEKEIAVWWADDPSETFTPPGHSYNLASIAIKTAKADLGKAAETYARVGMGVADAFINCWKCKFTYNNERPYTFVRRSIDTNWIPFWPSPPFPGFVSGHATQSATTAIILTDMYGSSFKFTDNSHVGRKNVAKPDVALKARSFDSFWETAEESAQSRFYGGIHTRQDNDLGLQEGRKLGRNINELSWKK